MHAFMAAVLLRPAGLDKRRLNAEAYPANRQLREPLDRVRRERRSIVGQHGIGQAVLAKEPLEHGPGQLERSRAQSPTTDDVAAERIGHGQGIAIASIPGSEVSLEVGAPLLVRTFDRLRRRSSRMREPPSRAWVI